MFQENSIETCILSRVKEITSPGWMHETSARTWCTGKTQRDWVEREVGGGTRMGNTCKKKKNPKNCVPRGHLTRSEDNLGCYNWKVLLISREQTPGILLNILYCRDNSPRQRVICPQISLEPRSRYPGLNMFCCLIIF